MNITWEITDNDVSRARTFLQQHDNAFVTRRILRNVNREDLHVDRDTVLKAIVMCLLTTQQRSGPNTPVARFLRIAPFPLTVQAIADNGNIKAFVQLTLQNNGLNRFTDKISTFLQNIFLLLQQDNWTFIDDIIETLNGEADSTLERKKADEVHMRFSGNGFGPKQSRNLLQALGLTKYEIPIDSRITSWLNNFGFPVTLSSTALQDKGYYHFVSEGIQLLCNTAEIYPCVLDAAIFSSFDKGQWTIENAID